MCTIVCNFNNLFYKFYKSQARFLSCHSTLYQLIETIVLGKVLIRGSVAVWFLYPLFLKTTNRLNSLGLIQGVMLFLLKGFINSLVVQGGGGGSNNSYKNEISFFFFLQKTWFIKLLLRFQKQTNHLMKYVFGCLIDKVSEISSSSLLDTK